MDHTDKLGISKYFSMEYRMVFFFGPLLAKCIVKDQSQRYLGLSGNSAWNFHKGKNKGDMAKSKLKADEKNLTLT